MQTHQHPIAARAICRITACTCALALLCGAAPLVQAKNKEGGTSVSVAKPKKPPKIKMENSSGENTAERDRRLLRECKGRPNAGACMGYAS